MLNCVDMDGQCKGYDLALVRAVRGAVTIPVIASSGAGAPQHFSEVSKQASKGRKEKRGGSHFVLCPSSLPCGTHQRTNGPPFLHPHHLMPQVFNRTGVEAALAAGIFHRREVEISAVKAHLKEVGIPVRIFPPPGEQPPL